MPKRFVIAAIAAVVYAGTSGAFIQRTTPLKDVIASESWVFVARIDIIDAVNDTMTLTVANELKGKAPQPHLAINVVGDEEAQKKQQKVQLLERLAPGMELVVFGSKRGARTTLFAFTNGTWFQIVGAPRNDESAVFAFTHFEPYLRRTFKGATAELKQIVADSLAGKKDPPPPNPNEPPGIGLPVKK